MKTAFEALALKNTCYQSTWLMDGMGYYLLMLNMVQICHQN